MKGILTFAGVQGWIQDFHALFLFYQDYSILCGIKLPRTGNRSASAEHLQFIEYQSLKSFITSYISLRMKSNDEEILLFFQGLSIDDKDYQA